MDDTLRARMGSLLLNDHPPLPIVDVVRRLGATQAQDFAASRWAIGLRTADPDITDVDVIAAYDRGEIVRGWPMRGTLHCCLPADLPWMLSLTAERTLRSARTRRAQLGLDDSDISRAREVAVELLGGGGRASRAEMQEAWQAAGIATDSQRGYHLIWTLAHLGDLVWGPCRGTEQLLVLSSEWLGTARQLDHGEALAEFLVRYLRGHGPATAADFRWWSGLTAVDTRTALAVAGDRVERVDQLLRAASAGDENSEPRAVLALPGFDEHLLGYRDRALMLAPEHAEAIVPGGNGMFMSTVVVDGRVVATWHRSKRARTIDIETRTLPDVPSGWQKDAEAQFRAYSEFVGRASWARGSWAQSSGADRRGA